MQDKQLLVELLAAETEEAASAALTKRGLLDDASRWKALGNMPNNQSVVHNQQSTAAAALVEKITNGIDAILMRKVRAADIDPRGPKAPQAMSAAVDKFYGDLSTKSRDEIRQLAEESMILYATGTKSRPWLSVYDAGEGQLSADFPKTFCSLIYGSDEGSYKGAVPFAQGRFNMGGTGVLPFAVTTGRCSSSSRVCRTTCARTPMSGVSPSSASSHRSRARHGSTLSVPMAMC